MYLFYLYNKVTHITSERIFLLLKKILKGRFEWKERCNSHGQFQVRTRNIRSIIIVDLNYV